MGSYGRDPYGQLSPAYEQPAPAISQQSFGYAQPQSAYAPPPSPYGAPTAGGPPVAVITNRGSNCAPFAVFGVCCCFFGPFIFVMIFAVISSAVTSGGPPGECLGPHDCMATSFTDQGSIDNTTVNICDGDFGFTVSAGGSFQ